MRPCDEKEAKDLLEAFLSEVPRPFDRVGSGPRGSFKSQKANLIRLIAQGLAEDRELP